MLLKLYLELLNKGIESLPIYIYMKANYKAKFKELTSCKKSVDMVLLFTSLQRKPKTLLENQ